MGLMYHPINCLDNEPLSLYFQFLIPWSYRCCIGFSYWFYQVFHSDSHHFTSVNVSITLISPVLFPAFPSMICFSLCYSFHTHAKKKIEESTSIHTICTVLFSSVHFSHSVMSDSLQPHESQHARPPCPSPTPRVHPNSCPSSRWCHPAISSSVIPFSSCPQSLPASGSFINTLCI